MRTGQKASKIKDRQRTRSMDRGKRQACKERGDKVRATDKDGKCFVRIGKRQARIGENKDMGKDKHRA